MIYMQLFRPFFIYLLASLATLSLSRLGLTLWQLERVPDAHSFAYILLQGLRFDLILFGLVMIIPLTLTPLMYHFQRLQPAWQGLLRVYLTLCFASLLFVELSTPSFINQYDLRPNFLFVEYLKYPKEVFATLWTAYRIPLLASILVTALATYALNRQLKSNPFSGHLGALKSIVLPPLLLLLCVMMVRSTLDHRPVNPSTVAFSSDPLVNTLPLNSAYSVLYAIYETRHEDGETFPYGELDEQHVVDVVQKDIQYNPADVLEARTDIPTLHKQTAARHPERPMNLVIILEESLGSEYVGALNGKPFTPNLDALSKQGIWFENLYATGTRSVRGIEAVVTGFTPSPSRSVVKLPRSQTGFFTIASLLKQYDYNTSFIYGGEAHFDNMRRFFSNNGFDYIVDEKDYANPAYYGSWGVSDEDLFNKAHETYMSYKPDQPFFSLVFTSSNHPPFDFPDGRIEITGEKASVDNAVKYADYALGQFIEKARKSPYWENTLFLIVADHCDQVYGSELVPVRHFHIPGLILGKDIAARSYSAVSSQIDLLPTMLSLMGISSEHPAIGRDLSYDILQGINRPGRAIMQVAGTQAYMEDNKVVVLQKDKQPVEFIYQDEILKPSPEIHTELVDKALAHANWSLIAYRKNLYHLPEQSVTETRPDVNVLQSSTSGLQSKNHANL